MNGKAHNQHEETTMEQYTITINERELATVLAALRFWQAKGGFEYCDNDDIADIATDCNNLEPMYAEEIDAFCETINCSPTAN